MMFEWGEEKNKKNIKKHNISFEEAIQIFESDYFTWVDSRKDYNEIREISIGTLEKTIVLVVVHTDRNGKTRIISARPAKKKERRIYDEHFKKTP